MTHHEFDTPARRRVGLSPTILTRFEATALPGAAPFRVARVDATGCTLLGAEQPLRAHIPKRLRTRTPVVVGDWVLARERGPESSIGAGLGGAARTHENRLELRQRLERSSSVVRRAAGTEGRAQVLVANLDRVLICMGLDRDFRLTRLERWLSLVHAGGAEPVVVLTKAGLVDAAQRDQRVREAQSAAPGIEVLALDVIEGLGLAALDESLRPSAPWATSLALVGSSGVGKSTLLNFLCRTGRPDGSPAMATAAVSEAHGKGRHTTSHRELFTLPERGLVVIDTPGLREVGIWDEGQGLEATFAEITALARGCRFSDCGHAGEPGCAVAAALETGALDARRLDSWRRLEAEREATARRADVHARRQHERSFAKLVRQHTKAKRRRGGR